MVYLEYNPSEGNHVEVIHVTKPILANGNLVAASENFKIGDEFEYYIVVNEVKDGYVVSSASVRQAPAAKYVLEQLEQAKVDIVDVRKRIGPLELSIKG